MYAYLYCTYKVGSFPVSPSPGKEGGRIEEKGRGGGKSDCVELDKSKKFLDGKKKLFPSSSLSPIVSLQRKSKREKEGRVFFIHVHPPPQSFLLFLLVFLAIYAIAEKLFFLISPHLAPSKREEEGEQG